MEKVRFEAFNVEELRVLRRACYEAGAAFGDPGHTAAERATLDDLAVEILGELKKKEAAAAQQRQEEPLEKAAKEPEKGAAGSAAVCAESFPEARAAEKARGAAAGHSGKGKSCTARRKRPQGPGAARRGKVYRLPVCALRKMRPGTRLLRKDTDFLVLLPGVRRENGAQKYAPGQDLVRVRQRLPVPHEYPGRRI